MRRVIFPLIKAADSNLILYPDFITLFANSEILGDSVIADYTGTMALTEYIPAPPAPPAPGQVTQRQARLQLLSLNLLDTVESAISGMERAEQITWQYASAVYRTDPLVAQMQQLLGWTDDETDQYFSEASQL